MSSPFRRSDSLRGSPARSRINGLHHPRTNGLNHDINEYCEEMSRLHIDTEKAYQKLLDERSREQKRKHLEGLEKALEQHEQVQKSARECVERIQLEQQQARLRQEQEQTRKLEEERRKLEEAERIVAEERKEAERKREEQRQAEAKHKQEEEAARKAAEQKKKEDEEARQKAEREKAAAEQAAKAQQQQTQQTPTQQPQTQPTSAVTNGVPAQSSLNSVTSSVEDRQKVHEAYLAIHQRLKGVRQTVLSAMNGNRQLKEAVTSATNDMRKSVGQISRKDKKGNKEKMAQVIAQIDRTLAINEMTDITQFMYNPTPVQPIQGPLLLVYMLNRFTKYILRQLESEVGSLTTEKGDGADVLGIAVAWIFSNANYLIEGRPLIDILWATYHRNCPRIFGVPVRSLPKNIKGFGPLAAGYAAITLRQFPTGRVNPAPNRMFWEGLARIVNTPLPNMKKDHLVMLEWMLQPTFVSKFIQIYGAAALVAVRHAIMGVAPAARQNEKLRSDATGVYDLRITLDLELHLPLS